MHGQQNIKYSLRVLENMALEGDNCAAERAVTGD
jgi:predicted transcriptional regulator